MKVLAALSGGVDSAVAAARSSARAPAALSEKAAKKPGSAFET